METNKFTSKMRLGKWLIVALLFALGTVVFSFYLLGKVPEQSSAKSDVEKSFVSAPVIVESRIDQNVPAAAASNVSSNQPASNKLLGKLNEAKDLRIFFTEALKHPKDGGVMYAGYVLALCRAAWNIHESSEINWRLSDLPYNSSEDSKLYAARNDAYHKAREYCQSFTADELSSEYAVYLDSQAISRGDELSKIASKRRNGNKFDIQERKSMLKEVLENGDPLLISSTLESLLITKSADGKIAYWFEGQQKSVTPEFVAALHALPCRLGMSCDNKLLEVQQACISQGKCGMDLVALIESELPSDRRAGFNKQLDLLESNVKSKDISRFIK